MKIKVTVELEEGTKITRDIRFTTESCIISSESLFNMIAHQASAAASGGAYRLARLVASNGMIVCYEEDEIRKSISLSDLLDLEYKKEAPIAAIKAMNDNLREWHNKKIKEKIKSIHNEDSNG